MHEKTRAGHGTLVHSIEKDFQDIMSSLSMDETQTSSYEHRKHTHHPIPQSAMLNGGGHTLVSSPTSPSAMSVNSCYENTSLPFSPVSTASVVSSPGTCLDLTYSRSTHTTQAPVPQPRTFGSKTSSSNGGLKDQGKTLTETSSSPTTTRKCLNQDAGDLNTHTQET